jgi:cytochrome c553
MRALAAASLCVLLTIGAGAGAGAGAAEAAAAIAVPAWLFPVNPPAPPNAPPPDGEQLRHLQGSSASYTDAQLLDLFVAPDWRPRSHDPMPLAVALGRTPDVPACGYCHLPSGQGRPENASLAGLPAAYILQQLADFQAGTRGTPWQGVWRPVEVMIQIAQHVTAADMLPAARYFERQQLNQRVKVIETERVPRPRVVGLVYAAEAGGAQEALGERLLEYSPDPQRHEMRDDQMVYEAYVPPGSIARGAVLARQGVAGVATACSSCHGPALRGLALAPPIAGRSPTALLRQLIAFRNGARHGAASAAMAPIMAQLELGQMIDAVAYAASLPP